MNPENLAFFAGELMRRTGLAIGPEKAYLIETRLASVARRHGHAHADALIGALRKGANEGLAREAIDALMTHETFFFRDIHPFETFREQILLGLIEQRAATRRLRIWCAAASTGQEPYTLAMIVSEEAQRLRGWTVEIVATDIAVDVLAYARGGLYSQFEVQRGLPIRMLAKYFRQEDGGWRLLPAVRNLVSYRQFNLLDDPAALGTFDVVFCRNVLIYFAPATKALVLERIARRLRSDGFLFLGGAETVIGITDCFTQTAGKRGIYSPAEKPARAPASPATILPSVDEARRRASIASQRA
jgi:chemotaxis protein methyltransferase CheR